MQPSGPAALHPSRHCESQTMQSPAASNAPLPQWQAGPCPVAVSEGASFTGQLGTQTDPEPRAKAHVSHCPAPGPEHLDAASQSSLHGPQTSPVGYPASQMHCPVTSSADWPAGHRGTQVPLVSRRDRHASQSSAVGPVHPPTASHWSEHARHTSWPDSSSRDTQPWLQSFVQLPAGVRYPVQTRQSMDCGPSQPASALHCGLHAEQVGSPLPSLR